MSKTDLAKLITAVVVLTLAAVLLTRFLRSPRGQDLGFFYDVSEKRLFTAPRTSVPPIRGLNDAEEDGVRAVVISTNAQPADRSSWTVAYLEKYSPELKRQMESAQAEGGSPAMGRAEAIAHRWVRRLSDSEWFPMNSTEAERIVTEWATPGASGVVPVVCTP